jgi:ubiquinone/menaquinone biosynthesis C-methylase UbiE
MRQREKVVPGASGEVLEIGIGSGLNLPYYSAERVSRLVGLDPSERSWELAGAAAEALPFPVEFIGLPSEQIPLPDASMDTVVVTYSLCTIPDPKQALKDMRRVLRPEGRLLFCEHARAPDAGVVKWQNRVNGIWKRLAGGCHLNRDILELIEGAGFSITERQQMYLPKTPRIAGFNVWGSAVPS